MLWRTTVFLPFFILWMSISAEEKLSEFIRYHEKLRYDSNILDHLHKRAKRSSDTPLSLKFKAYGNIFNLHLLKDTSTFASNLVVDTPDGELYDYDTSHIYTGKLIGHPDSYVSGSVVDGIFQGRIINGNQTYYVEKASRYRRDEDGGDHHSVIYSSSDVVDPFADRRTGHHGGCGLTQEHIDEIARMSEESQTNTIDEYDINGVPKDFSSHENMYSPHSQSEHLREKRAPNLNRTCSLYIQTDYLLFKHVNEKLNNAKKARDEITALIAEHVKAVNHIYTNTNFRGYNGFNFIVQRITINDTSSCDTPQKMALNLFCAPNVDVSNFLNLNSHANHNAFCLSYVFTYRDFSGGTLGLAWVATPGSSGGICEKYKPYNEKISDRSITIKRSLNTGIVTFVNYNNPVPPKVSQLTLAHEIGHNFGSLHDYPSYCRPGGTKGNFIMYSSATSGDRPNNSKFSQCSIGNISKVLTAIFEKGTKDNCFQKSGGSFCGNKIVEEGEECDCGYDQEECVEKCCYPRIISKYDKLNNGSAQPCARRYNTACSPSQGPCCTSSCQFEVRALCKTETDCTDTSFCNGRMAICPSPLAKPNKTDCSKGTKICLDGECKGSICEKYDLEECFLTSAHGANADVMCELACQKKGLKDSCQSSYHIAKSYRMKPLKLQPGSPCNDFQGYCDVFQKCRSVDAEGPLARLKNLIFNRKTLMTIAEWVTEYWWGVLLMGVGFIILMALFIKCCAVHTPSSNPRKAPALKITDTLRRPSQTLRRVRNRSQTAPRSQEPPPPYPGPPNAPAVPSTSGGPSHGYGEGRGHYNKRNKQSAQPQSAHSSRQQSQQSTTDAWTHEDPYAPAYPARGMIEMKKQRRKR